MVSIIQRDLFDYVLAHYLLALHASQHSLFNGEIIKIGEKEWMIPCVRLMNMVWKVIQSLNFVVILLPFLLKPRPITISSCLGQACQSLFHSFAKINFSGCRWRAAVWELQDLSPFSSCMYQQILLPAYLQSLNFHAWFERKFYCFNGLIGSFN